VLSPACHYALAGRVRVRAPKIEVRAPEVEVDATLARVRSLGAGHGHRDFEQMT